MESGRGGRKSRALIIEPYSNLKPNLPLAFNAFVFMAQGDSRMLAAIASSFRWY